MTRRTAPSTHARTKRWHTFIVSVLIVTGLILTAIITWINVRSSYQLWEQGAMARADQLSESLRYRVWRNREPLIAISTLYSGSDDVTQAELEMAYQQIMSVTSLDVDHLLAFVSDQNFEVQQVAGSLTELPTVVGEQLDSRLHDAIRAARENPGSVLFGALVRPQNTSYLPVVISAHNAEQSGTLLYLLNFSRLLDIVTAGAIESDITFSLYYPLDSTINHASLPPLASEAEAHYIRNIDMGLHSWQLDWSFDADSGGGIDQRLSYTLALGGTLITLLASFILMSLLHQDRIVRQQIDRKSRELEDTQAMLIKREKMAALGKMVAGISHELNTPIGNTLLAATLLRSRSKDLVNELTERNDAIETFVSVATESTYLIEKNIQRATELIRSLKHVSVDQSSERRRQFNLADTLQELAQTLSPGLRAEKLRLTLDVPVDIYMDSYPGALYQIISNLVTNAMAHAYPENAVDPNTDYRGELLLQVEYVNKDLISLRFSDDGAGIDPAARDHIFEPFFTTSMGSGGSGLGLHIVATLVSDVLGGSITLENTRHGTHFLIILPLTAP